MRVTPPQRRSTARAASALAAVVLLTACGGGTEDEPTAMGTDAGPATEAAPVAVVATTSILGDIVRALVGDDGEVTVLMGPGVDPHAYSPSARDAATLRDADLVVANGLGLEASLLDTVAAAEEAGVPVFEVAPEVDPIEYEDEGHDDAHADEGEDAHADEGEDAHADEGEDAHADDDHEHGPEDPHVWFDPDRMAIGVELLAAELAEVAPQIDAQEWEARGAAYADELRAIGAELAEAFDAVPDDRRVIVTNHDSLGYLAARYDLEVVGTVIPGSSTQVEADPRGFAELVALVDELDIDVVFAENTDSTRLAEQLAGEVAGRSDTDIEVVQVATDALGEPGSGSETYLDLLRGTGTTIATRLAAS